jgi:hypothetical protein
MYSVFFFLMGWDWVHLALRPLVGLLYRPRMIDDDCGAIGGMRVGRGNRSTRRKPASVPIYPPQIPHDLTRARTRAAAVGNRRLTAWAMARPSLYVNIIGYVQKRVLYGRFKEFLKVVVTARFRGYAPSSERSHRVRCDCSVLNIMLLPLLSTSFPVYYSLIILSCDDTQSELFESVLK